MYYKIKTGYNELDFVPIDQSELETAFYAFLSDSKAIFKNGVVRGKDIIAITPDYHREMNWNYTHKLNVDDFAELRKLGIESKAMNLLETAKEKVQYLIKTNQTNLIGKNVDIGLKSRNEIRGGEIKSIGDILNNGQKQ